MDVNEDATLSLEELPKTPKPLQIEKKFINNSRFERQIKIRCN